MRPSIKVKNSGFKYILKFIKDQHITSATLTVNSSNGQALEILLIPRTRKKLLKTLSKDIKKRLKPRT